MYTSLEFLDVGYRLPPRPFSALPTTLEIQPPVVSCVIVMCLCFFSCLSAQEKHRGKQQVSSPAGRLAKLCDFGISCKVRCPLYCCCRVPHTLCGGVNYYINLRKRTHIRWSRKAAKNLVELVSSSSFIFCAYSVIRAIDRAFLVCYELAGSTENVCM